MYLIMYYLLVETLACLELKSWLLYLLWWISGMLSTAASLGMLLLWDVDGGLTQIDKYLYSNEDYIKVCEEITIQLLPLN